MIDYRSFFEEDLGSHRLVLLADLLDKQVIEMVRYIWYPPEEFAAEQGIPASTIFRFAPGPLLLRFESGLVVGFGSLPEKASVTVWVETMPDGQCSATAPISEDEELFPIQATDTRYSDAVMAAVVGRRILSMQIFTREPKNLRLAQVPREAGIGLECEHGPIIIIAHGLHNDSDDMAVIERDQILPEIREKLHATHMLGRVPPTCG